MTIASTRIVALERGPEVFAGGPAVEHGAAPAVFVAGVLARLPGPEVGIVARRDPYPPAGPSRMRAGVASGCSANATASIPQQSAWLGSSMASSRTATAP